MSTAIGWTNETWNPVTGCTKVSAGCKHCYAERITERWGQKFTDIVLHPDRLEKPLHWRKPRRIFVNSMSDLFHEKVPFEFIDKVFAVMALCPQHTFQVLTKRPERMAEYLSVRFPEDKPYLAVKFGTPSGHFRSIREYPISNLWLGTSIEDQESADKRVPELLKCPAAVRFLSYEPALGPVDLGDWLSLNPTDIGIDWVIVGGESGPGFRTMNLDWLRSVVGQCKAAGVPVFVKQASGLRPGQQGNIPDDLWALKESP